MVGLLGLGIIAIFNAIPALYSVLKVGSALYLTWLAWKIATAAPAASTQSADRPFSFMQAVAFQWVNPKGWTMALTAATVYTPDQTLAAVTMVAVVFGLVGTPCMALWTLLGQEMRRFLTTSGRLRAFNITMALILVASLIPAFLISAPAQ